jgi:hypothetical protein
VAASAGNIEELRSMLRQNVIRARTATSLTTRRGSKAETDMGPIDGVGTAWATVGRELRHVLGEKGDRLAAAGRLASTDDVEYLTIDEVTLPPASVTERIASRRQEHMRLNTIAIPSLIDQRWLQGHRVSHGQDTSIGDANNRGDSHG